MDTEQLRKQAEAGNTAAQAILGIGYLEGTEVEVDYAEAFRLLTEASRKGASRAIVYLARMYRDGLGIPQDAAEALRLYEVAARAGEFFAQIELGRAFSGVDPGEALRWYAAAAAHEDSTSECDELREAKAFVSQKENRR